MSHLGTPGIIVSLTGVGVELTVNNLLTLRDVVLEDISDEVTESVAVAVGQSMTGR